MSIANVGRGGTSRQKKYFCSAAAFVAASREARHTTKPAENALPAFSVPAQRIDAVGETLVPQRKARAARDRLEAIRDRRLVSAFPRGSPRLHELVRRVDLAKFALDRERIPGRPDPDRSPSPARANVGGVLGGAVRFGRAPPLRDVVRRDRAEDLPGGDPISTVAKMVPVLVSAIARAPVFATVPVLLMFPPPRAV